MQIPNLGKIFKSQGMTVKGLTGTMQGWAGNVSNRAILRGSVTNRAIRSSIATRGGMDTLRLLAPGMKANAMTGAMIGAGAGAGMSLLGDTAGNNLNGGSFGRAIGGGFRGALLGGFSGAAMGAFRPSMSVVSSMNKGSGRAMRRARTVAIRSNARYEMGLR